MATSAASRTATPAARSANCQADRSAASRSRASATRQEGTRRRRPVAADRGGGQAQTRQRRHGARHRAARRRHELAGQRVRGQPRRSAPGRRRPRSVKVTVITQPTDPTKGLGTAQKSWLTLPATAGRSHHGVREGFAGRRSPTTPRATGALGDDSAIQGGDGRHAGTSRWSRPTSTSGAIADAQPGGVPQDLQAHRQESAPTRASTAATCPRRSPDSAAVTKRPRDHRSTATPHPHARRRLTLTG